MRDEQAYLLDILEACNAIDALVHDLTYEQLARSRRDQSSLLFELTIIGEAAAHIPEDFRMKHSNIGWHLMAGARNVIVHGYFGVDWVRIWRTATTDVPELRPQIAAILNREFGNGSTGE